MLLRLRLLLCLIVLVPALGAAGCGSADHLRDRAQDRVDEIRRTADQIRRDAERLRDRLAKQVQETLARIRQVVPAASRPVPERAAGTRLETFLLQVRRNIAGYWTQTLRGAGLPAPRVRLILLRPRERGATGCGAPADETSAFYCPADDSIYLGETFADHVLRGTGDFGVAYVLAHEYAHNIQQELGWYGASAQTAVVKPFELQADCMAGAWGNSVYRAGQLDPGDVQEAQRTAYSVGDFEVDNPQHHGTPQERLDAWEVGFDRGDPAACRRYVPT